MNKHAKRVSGVKPLRGQGYWYTRHVMWSYASKYEVNSIKELSDEDYMKCIEETHKYLRDHSSYCKKGKCVLVARGMGPQGVADRSRDRTETSNAAEDYNGVDGGRVYMYYSPGVFARMVHRLGCTFETCTERQCVDVLRAVNNEIDNYPMVRVQLKPYAGPQCFAQLQDKERLYANMPGEDTGVGGKIGTSDKRFNVLRDCWMRCDNENCKKWRLVDPGSLKSLRPETFAETFEGSETYDWKRWLGDAGVRYAEFLKGQAHSVSDTNAAADAGAGVAEPGDMQRGAEEDLFCGVCAPDLCESEGFGVGFRGGWRAGRARVVG